MSEPIFAALIAGLLIVAVVCMRRMSKGERERLTETRRMKNHVRAESERQEAEGWR